jgi:hypothetical protein
MADITLIREAIAANLATVTGLQISAFMLGNPTTPSCHIFPGGPAGDLEYDLAMARGLDRLPFTVQVFVAANNDQGPQRNLDKFMATEGALSIRAALESDRTLGGLANDLRVVRCTGYRQYVFDGRPPLLGAEWHVDVLTNDS